MRTGILARTDLSGRRDIDTEETMGSGNYDSQIRTESLWEKSRILLRTRKNAENGRMI